MGNSQTFQKARHAVFRLSVWQLLLTLAFAGCGGWLVDKSFALSVIAGGGIGMVAGSYQAQRMLRVDAGLHPEAFMRALWTSELIKIVLTVAFFIAAIRVFQVAMVPTIIGYAGTYIVYWLALGTRFPWFESGHNNPRDKNWPDA